jgi:hypothetical protein
MSRLPSGIGLVVGVCALAALPETARTRANSFFMSSTIGEFGNPIFYVGQAELSRIVTARYELDE